MVTNGYDDEVRDFVPPSAANEVLDCQLLIVGGGFSGLSAAHQAVQRGLDVIVIEKGRFGKEAASGLNAGQFLTGWAKSVRTMLADLAVQEMEHGLTAAQAGRRAEKRVRAFMRRTIEGCQRIAQLDHEFNLRASVHNGAVIAAVTENDLTELQDSYAFMSKGNFRNLMPVSGGQHLRFYEKLTAKALQKRYDLDAGRYAGGIVDYFGGSFQPRKMLNGLGAALHKKGVRFFHETAAASLDFPDERIMMYCDNGTAIRADCVLMANAYSRHINPDVEERSLFCEDYVVKLRLPSGSGLLEKERVFSDTREPCFYARRHGDHLYIGFEESDSRSPEITQHIKESTLKEAQRIFPALRGLILSDIESAWSGTVRYTTADYPFLERQHGGRLISFAAPSDHGNSIAFRAGQLVVDWMADALLKTGPENSVLQRMATVRNVRLFEGFPKGQRLRPGARYRNVSYVPETPDF